MANWPRPRSRYGLNWITDGLQIRLISRYPWRSRSQYQKVRILTIASSVAVAAFAAAQVGQIIKVIGIGAAVQKFGPEMNKGINKLTSHSDTPKSWTKVVPIISVGSRKAIGAAQVTGPKSDGR